MPKTYSQLLQDAKRVQNRLVPSARDLGELNNITRDLAKVVVELLETLQKS